MESAPIKSLACALCSFAGKLEQSHIIPQFVYRGLKQPSGPERAQGGPARPLLCGKCEDRFSLWESQFARDVFHPLVAGRAVPVKYGRWLPKFAASVCWRILESARRENQLGPIQARWSAGIADCLETWSDFLRDRRPDVGAHHLHLLREERSGRGFAPQHESIESEVTGSDAAAWVYAKMGPLVLFGLIRDESPGQWGGTRINLEGKLKPGGFVVPAQYGQYLARRAALTVAT